MNQITNDWNVPLSAEFAKPYYQELMHTVEAEYASTQVYPAKEDVFNAFFLAPLQEVKVVILGQDPYHEPNQAHGLAFSVMPGVDVPPSLTNIYKELQDDIGCAIPNNGCLVPWAKQGVLLLNTVLTVRAHEANSHRGIGWETFTDAVIATLDTKDQPIVFLLWGRPAQRKKALLHARENHLILEAPHPSPLSSYRGFFGCKHFSETNRFLEEHGATPVDWQIPDVVF